MRSEHAYSIAEASEIVGVPKPTIRSWELRYRLTDPGRSQGGHRRYSHSDLIRIAAFRDMVAAGTPPEEAAALVPKPSRDVEAFLAAAADYDSMGIDRILTKGEETDGIDATISSLVFPAMFQVGELWRATALDVGHEHLATQTVRSWLGRMQRRFTSARTSRSIMFAAAPGEHHTIGIESLAVLCASRKAACKVVGANVPNPSLVKAVSANPPDALVVSAQLNVNRGSAVAGLRLTKTMTKTYFAGRAFASNRSRRSVPGTYLTSDLLHAADILMSDTG